MDKLSIFRSTGIAVGIVVGIIICLIAFRYINKDKKVLTQYDERQEKVRGKAYMYGFWGIVVAAAIVICIDTAGIVVANRFATDFFIIFVGIFIQVAYSIWNDGYYGINTNKRRFFIVFWIASIINLLVVVVNIANGTFIENGVMSDSVVNLMCFILFLLVAIELTIKKRFDHKQDAQEE